MTESNKKNLVDFGKTLAIARPGFIAIITFAGVLNGVVGGLDSFYGWVAGINLGVEAFLLYRLAKSIFKKNNEQDKK